MYILEVTDDNGCTAEMLFEVRDCAAPGTPCFQGISVITPNSDNINDEFIITCVSDNPNTLTIFDRWGRTVFEDTNYSNDWEGIDLDGEALPEGAYYWVLEVLFDNGDSRVMKGTVTLLRND